MQNGEDVVDNEIRACLISASSFNYSAIKKRYRIAGWIQLRFEHI